ncbi:MAG: c-type cytochrome [Limisphaerales bacterium]
MHLRILACSLACGAFATALSAAEPASVQMLTPGFTVRELPVRISNINNLRFSPEGHLTALGYDGRIHILRDTDGDGLEDSATLFWDKPTLSVPVGMVWSTNGIHVSSHGKVSLLRDTNGDGVADDEVVIATGWPPTDVGSGGVDATAVTRDSEGNLYFGLLTADYSNPYRVRNGVSHYDLNSRRGTIQKWTAATGELTTIATGIRVPYALAFNRHGDLFVTDQEGETWCPGGNPLDELNHIVPGRNYGFPPRDPAFLPTLVSESPIVGFGPQHQSTCGLVFNEASAAVKPFGPASWEGDAFVAGESRGKIWRVRLVRTPDGYVGRETIVARLSLLTTDVAVSPQGDLYVSCHSGPPDWGTGPNGEGKLFRISYSDPAAPQPVAAWPESPMRLHVAFDRAIDPAVTNRPEDIAIEFGEYVSAADRYEVLKPPYQTVTQQELTPRGRLRVISAEIARNHRTLVLTTDPHPQTVRYAVSIPGIRAHGSTEPPATVDLAYDLTGLEATWFASPDASKPGWSGWLPHLDPAVSAAFTSGTSTHATLSALMRRAGELRLRTTLDLPSDATRLRFEAATPFSVRLGDSTGISRADKDGLHVAELAPDPETVRSPIPLRVDLTTGSPTPPSFRATVASASHPEPRPLAFQELRLPWAPPRQAPSQTTPPAFELAGGDPGRGRSLFVGERLKCSTCHRIRGEGAIVGPDLTNATHRDPASVLRDIREPDAMIHPDYVAYHVRLKDGEELTGFVKARTGDSLSVFGADGKDRLVNLTDVVEMGPAQVSLMPANLLEGVTEGEVRDLLAFLLLKPTSETTPATPSP